MVNGLTDTGPGPTPTYRRLSSAETPGAYRRRRRHAVVAIVIAGYLLASGVAVAAHGILAMPGWLALHLLVLGAASNAVLVYSRHFAQALLHVRPASEWPASARLAVFNLGTVAVLLGMSIPETWLAVTGAVLVVGAVIGHTASLVAMARAASLSGRLRVVVWYYVGAGVALLIGGSLGGVLTGGVVRSAPWEHAVRLAHAHLNLLGWLGLVVIGTLFMLWPAVLRTRMADTAPQTARRVLGIMTAGLSVAVTGALLTGPAGAAHWLAAAGMAAYTGGVAYALLPAIREMRAKPPRSAAPVALLAGYGWLLAALAIDVAGLVLGPASADDLLGRVLAPMLGIGVIAQILTGALAFLLPVTVGGGPAGNRRLTQVLEYAWLPRGVLGNLGTLLVVLPVTGELRVLAWTLVLVGFGSYPMLVAAALLVRRRPATDPAAEPTPRWRLAGHEILAVSCVAAVLAVLALVGTGTWPSRTDSAAGASTVTATSGTPVEVSLDEFTVTPPTITVAPNTDLVLTVRNVGHMTHDLKLNGQHGTRMLAPGQQQTVELGPIKQDSQAWCTVPGHRQAGMVLTIRTTTAASPPPAGRSHHAMPDMNANTPPPTWQPYDPTLRPAPGGTEHNVTLRVEHTTIEVAPGVRQQVWTYNGTVPAPVLHGRVGDLFTVHLINDSSMPHSIDFHASQVDPGTAMRSIPPGGELTYSFRAEHAGAWLYHCSTAPMIQHIAMGMYGAIIIDPPTLGPAAASYVLVQSEFYLGPDGGIPGMPQLLAADPNLVVFNGYADQYRHAPIRVRAGERIRLWIVDAGPNNPSVFHVVGAQFDTVFKEGAYQLRPGNAADGAAAELDLQPGQGGFVEVTFPRPGTYPMVTHRLADAQRGAMGTIIAEP